MQMYTDRQVALQAAVEYAKTSGNINNSFDVVMIAERFRKFIEEGTVETKNIRAEVADMHAYTGTHKPKVGSLCF